MGFFSVVFFFSFRKDRFVSPLAIPLRPLRLCEKKPSRVYQRKSLAKPPKSPRSLSRKSFASFAPLREKTFPRVLVESLSPSRQARKVQHPVSPLRSLRLCEKKTSRVYQLKVSRQVAKIAKSNIPLVLCVLRAFARKNLPACIR